MAVQAVSPDVGEIGNGAIKVSHRQDVYTVLTCMARKKPSFPLFDFIM